MAVLQQLKLLKRSRVAWPSAKPQAAIVAVVLAAWCAVLFFYGLNTGDLWRTEGLRALVASEMLQSGDWIVPRLYGQPLLTKPPGMYVAIAAASWPVGEVREWTARLPSALAASATVFLFAWYFSRQLGRRAGLIAALILPSSLMWLDKATLAEIDMLHVAWVTAAVLFFLRALEAEEAKTRRQGDTETPRLMNRSPCLPVSLSPRLLFWLSALLCVAGGTLTKWSAPAFFYLTVFALLWRRRQLRLLVGWPHLVSAGMAAVVCLSWAAAAIQDVGWETFFGTVGREALARILPDRYGRPYPWRQVPIYPLVLFAVNLPWSAFALVTLWPGFARRWDVPGRQLLQALHCWLWPNLCLWSLISEHAPRHGFPMFPAIAGFAAMVWVAWIDGRLSWPFRRDRPASVLAALLIVWLGVKIAFVQVVPFQRNALRMPRTKGENLAELVPAGQTLSVFQLRDRDEAMLFYFGRPVRRLTGENQLASMGGFCLLTESEWNEWSTANLCDNGVPRLPSPPVLRGRGEGMRPKSR